MQAQEQPSLTSSQQAMLDVFQQHLNAEMTGDIDATMATMINTPYVNHVPVLTGGVGREGVRHFYTSHLVGKLFPPDAELTNVSRTVGEDQLVEEVVLKFTHTVPIDWMLPGVAHEHIYWDQASVLVQLGLLSPSGLPVSGVESAHKVLDPKLPPRDI